MFVCTLYTHSHVTLGTVTQGGIHTNDSILLHCSKPSPIITVFLQTTSILVFQSYNWGKAAEHLRVARSLPLPQSLEPQFVESGF